MKFDRKAPCKECPFTTLAFKGWLGPYTDPGELHREAQMEAGFPCHMSVNDNKQEGIEDVNEAHLCIGAQMYSKNVFKMFYNPELREYAKTLKPLPHVFKNFKELCEHHKNHEAIAGAVEKREMDLDHGFRGEKFTHHESLVQGREGLPSTTDWSKVNCKSCLKSKPTDYKWKDE